MSSLGSLLRNPLVISGSLALTGYGIYSIVTTTQAGKTYDIPDLKGKTYIVTGPTRGLGRALSEKLAEKNARVILACRDRQKCLETRRDIVFETRNKEVYCRMCDMSDPDSIREFASKLIKGKHEIDRIDGIICNAATVEPKRKVNESGMELSLATNYMGPFLLTGLLLQKLLNQTDIQSKIIFLNTAVVTKDRLELDLNVVNDARYTRKGKLDPEHGRYYGGDAYLYSKALLLCFNRELAERLHGSNVSVISVDPGWTRTNLEQRVMFKSWHWLTGNFLRRPDKAIKPILYAIADENVKNGTFVNRDLEDHEWGKNANDQELRKNIWAMGEQWTRLGEHMARLQEQLELDPDYFGKRLGDLNSIRGKDGRHWYWLWLR